MKTLVKILYSFLLIALLPNLSFGQTATWNYRVNSGTLGTTYSWIDCTDGTELNSSNLDAGNGRNRSNLDDGRWTVAWPFSFTYYDDSYTTSDNISVCTNGFMRFDGLADHRNWSGARDYVLDATPSTDFGQILCYAISDCDFSDSNSKVFYKVTGTSPNRIFTIEFVDIGFYWAANMYGNVEVSFYETSNIIVLKTGTNNVTYEGAEMGLHSGVSPYFHWWQDIDNSAENTWIEYIPTVATSNDQTSYARPPAAQPNVTSFSTSSASPSDAHEVLKFTIYDAGGDGVPTKVSKIRIKNAHPTNEADWSNTLAGVVLNDGSSDIPVGVTTIDDEYIDFLFNIDDFDVPDGGSTDLTLKIYLQAGTAIEGQQLQFYIDDNDHGWYHDQLGSGFLANFGNATDITSEIFTFTTVATELRFTVQPPAIVHSNEVISPTITVSATDAAGNVDNSYTGTITLTNSGAISWTNNSVAAVNGVAEFTNLQFTATGGPITLSTSNVEGLTEANSTETTVAYKTVLFFDDFEDATQSQADWAVSGTAGIWEVGNQTDDAFGPPSGYSANGVYGTKLNANYGTTNVDAYLDCPIIDLAGTADPIVSFWMDMESEAAWDGGTVQIRVNNGGTWGAFTTISMGDTGYSGNIPNDTDVDGLANSEDGWSGDSPAGEWAKVVIDLFNLSTTGLTNITASSLIQVRFWFGADNIDSNYPGWYIDDFEVSYTSFPGLWSTAAGSTDWFTAANWDDGNVPSGIFVTIPASAANYPSVNASATASTLLIQDGGQLNITTAGDLSLSQNLMVGEGASGSFTMDDGNLAISGDLYSELGSSVTISGGTVSLANWMQKASASNALGTITLSGGTISASGNVMFADANVSGAMSGDFVLNVSGDFYNSNNTWSVPTGGTLVMKGSVANVLGTTTGNSSSVYNLSIENTGGTSLNGSSIIENNCEISAVGRLNIPTASPMTVKGDMTLRTDNKNRAAFLDDQNLTVNGVSSVEIYTSTDVYHYISSPLSAVPTTTFSLAPWGDSNPNFYSYDESGTDADWLTGWNTPPAGNLGIGTGYAYLLTTDYTHSLSGGGFNTGNISVPVANSNNGGASNGWNLIGNPYPSPIDANAFILANSDADASTGLLTGTLYFWDDDASSGTDYATSDYSTYNRAGAVSGGNGKVVNGYIPVGQSFFVQANTSGNVSFTNAMRTLNPGIFFKEDEKPIHQKVLLSLENSQKDYNETLIAFISDATDDFDNLYDGEKIKGNANIAFYSTLGDKELAIQAFAPMNPDLDSIVEVPLGFDAGIAGVHQIKLKSFENLDAHLPIYIKDNYLNIEQELTLDNYYEFSTEAGQFTDRFVLLFKLVEEEATAVQNISVSTLVSIYSANKTIYILPKIKSGNSAILDVYDLTGRNVFSKQINLLGESRFVLEENKGIYIVQLKTEDGKLTTKKVFIQ